VSVLKMNPPHMPPASPVVAPLHAELQEFVTQPVSELKSAAPPGFAVRQPCVHVSSAHASTHR
jgi:hypothetical protein